MAKNYFADEPMPTLFTPTVTPVEQPSSQGRIGDTIDSLQSGGLSALGGMFDFIGAQGLAQSLYSSSNDQQAQMSERGREALGQQFIQEDKQGNFELGEGATDLDTWLLTMANVAGQFAGTAVPGAGAAGLAGKAASLGAKGKNIANIASMGATGGAAATGQGMEQARQEVQNMPDTLLAESPLFGDVFRGVHASQPELSNVEKWEAAKTALANKVAQEVRTDPKVLIANFGASAIGDPIIGKALTGARLAKSGALRSALAGFVTGGSTEAVQAGVQQLGINQALQKVDNRDEMQGVVAAGLNEGLAGGGFGAAAGGIGGLLNRNPQTGEIEPPANAGTESNPTAPNDPVTEQMKASNPDLGEAMASMDQHSTNVKNDVDNLDIPTAARQAGFNTNAGAGQFGDFITSPSQESLQGMRNQTIADMVNDAVNNIGPTPDDRFSPIKFTHEGELIQGGTPGSELGPFSPPAPQLGSAVIDGELAPEQSLLPSTWQTRHRKNKEQFNAQPAQLENKDIIFGTDNRPQQQAAQRVKQAGKDSQNLLPQKDIIFAGDQSGVNVARNGKPFKSQKEARNSKLARQAKRQGLTVDVVPFDNGYGWTIKDSSPRSGPILGADLGAENQQADANLTDKGSMPQQSESIEKPTANLAQPKGKRSTTFTPTGKQIETEFTIFDANDQNLITSNDSAGNSNPNYPQHLQPRDRTRVSSLAQISEIVNKMEPSRLGDSQETDRGAPIVKSGVVESGNGRVLAIRQAYKNGKAEKYKQFLIDNAEQFGLNKQDIEAMEAPILTRERLTELTKDELINFTVDSNRQAGIERSPAELALTDASLFTDDELKLLNVPENGNILSSDNKAFLNSFANKLGNNEAAKYRQSDGTWNSQFAARVNNAIFAKAYDSPDLISASSEATTKESANLINALVNGASKVAALKGPSDGTSVNNAFGQELAETVSGAANMIIKSRRDNLSIDDMISQQDAFTDRDEEAEALAKLLSKNIRSAKKMSAIINSIADDINTALMNAEQADIFTGETQPLPSMSEVLNNAEQQFTQAKTNTSGNVGDRSATEAQQPSQAQGMEPDVSQGSRSGGENAGVTLSNPEAAEPDATTYPTVDNVSEAHVQLSGKRAASGQGAVARQAADVAWNIRTDMLMGESYQDALAKQEARDSFGTMVFKDVLEQLRPEATEQSNNPEIPDSSTKPKKRKVYGWDRVELSKNYTAKELDEWIKELSNDPDNQVKDGIYQLDTKTRKKIDALSWAIYYIQKEDSGKGQSNTSQAPVKQAPIESGLDAYDSMIDAINKGELNSVADVKRVLDYLASNEGSVKAELKKLNKKQLTKLVSGHVWGDTKKAELVDSAYRDMFTRFIFIGNESSFISSTSYKLEDKISDAKKHVDSLTDQQVAEYSQEQKAKVDEQKARFDQYLDKIKNPQTLDDYKAKIKAQGQGSLTTEQQAEYDKLIAQETIQTKNERPAEKQGLNSDGDVELGEPVEGVHGKTGEKIFNVNVISRLGKDAFKEAAAFARSMGGGYYRGNFYFKSVEDAELFSGWVNGETVDTTEMQAKKSEQRNAKNKDKLQALADRAQEQANEALNADRKTNTVKRLNESQAATERAEKELALAKVMKEIPDSETIVIKGATQKVQVELLDQLSRSLVHSAPDSQVDKDSNSKRTFKESISNAEKAKHARMPLKTVRVFRLNELANDMLETKGFVLLGRKLKSITKGKADQDYVDIFDSVIPKYIDYINKHTSQYDMLRDEVANYKRLERMGVSNEPTLRTALIEYMDLRDQSVKATPKSKLSKMEQELQRTVLGNRKAFNDFFPTPETIAADIADMADIEQGMRVLEPSAGNGLLADAAREQGANVDVVEMAGQLREILQEKGYNLVGSDFLDVDASQDYDRIIMNPPFSNDQDIKHVEHAYKMLKPGGKLIAITSSGAGERSNKTNKEFKDWLDALDAEQQPLPEGAFKSSLNPTGVNTKVIVIEKPGKPGEINGTAESSKPNNAGSEIDQLGNELKASLNNYSKRSALEKRILKLVDDVKAANGNWYLVQKKLFDGEYESDIDAGIAEAKSVLSKTSKPESAKPKKQETPQENINDFGEKLGGARKDVWSGFSEAIQDQQNTAELPLSKAWPEPNYKELAEKGVSAESIALMAAMRSEIPPKPRVARKVSRWAEKVNTLKSFAADLMSGDRDIATVMQRMRNHSSKLAAIVDAIPSIAKADIDTLKSIADYRISSGSFSMFGGKKYSPSKVFYFIERNGRPVYDGASETLSDVQALLAKVIKAEQADGSNATNGKKSKISVYRDRYTKDVYLGWKGAAGVLKIKSFDDLGAAREYLKNNRDEVEQTLQKMKETPSMRKPVNDDRIGPERYAENVTPDTFGEAFGFRGVEFGNWVEQAKRQKDLNQAYDGLMDLAEALDIQPKALSLNGQLGLAFGARGKGGKEPAAAHYEPDTVVINLTKKAGAGSLAHEWWHALDNYFGKQKSKGEFITDMPYSMPTDQIRPEMADAFKHVRNAIVQSGLPERSKQLDARRSKAYWATPIEMTARSFETYIIDKLNQQGITNDYLANVVSDEAWSAAEALGFESSNTYPYPNKSEQEQINSAYQTLFDTMESENTSEGIRLFSKSKANKKAQGVNAEQAQEIANNFIKGLNGANGITVNILEDTATAEKLWRMSLDGATVKGAYSEMSNTVYVIAENIDSVADLKQTLAHETIAHGGLDTVIGKEAKQEFIDRIKKTKGRKAFEQYWKDANNDYWDMSDDVKAEEIFARFVENEPSKGELKYWWNALKRWIKAQLDKAGIMYREDDELTAMREMLESIVKGFKSQREPMVNNQTEMAYSQSDKKFSRTADSDTRTAKEKLGLEEQARETIADRAKEKVNETVDTLKSSSFWQRLNEGIFDGLAGIKQAEVSAGVTDPNKQGYVSARLASGLADVLHGVFNYGAPAWRDGIIQRKENTKGLLEVFGMVGDDLNNWLAWMGANRAEKLKEQGRENNLTQADIDELKALANGKEELFEQVRQEYNKVNSAILDVAQVAGLLSEEQRSSFDEEYYVPFFRDMGETDAELDDIKRMIVEPHMRKGIASQSAKIKELKGGKQSTKDLLENIIARQSTLIDASLKNKAMQEVTDNLDGTDYMQAETSEEIASLSQQELNKLHRVKVMRNGKAQAYMVSDPALLRALIQVNDVGSQSLFNKMGRSAKRFLTAGITLSPDFIFKNFVRDAAHAWMINKDDFKFGTDSIKGLKKAFKEDEAYRDLIFSGAAFQGGYIHGADPEAGAQQIRRALRSKGLTTNEIDGYLDTIVNSGAELLEKYRGISDKVENANRLSTYEAALAAGKSKRQAAYESKDLMDYSLKGNFKLIGTMIDMLPFFNARLQGMSKLVRAAKAGDGDRVLKVLSANLAMKGIKVAGFSLALAAMNDDDERYQELPDWDKDMNWHFFAGDQHFRIPKPFELGIIFGTLPERMLHTATGTQTGGDLGKAVANAVINTLALNPIPQFALPATEVLVNKSFFKDAPIEGMADENKQAEDRYNTYTSEVAKGIGSTFGVSPKKVEHLIKGYTGTIGGYVLGASDIVARQIMGKETADTPVSRYPVIKAFYQGSGPKGSTKFANDFYESLEAANQAYGSYKRAMEEGDTSRQQELIEGAGDKLRSRIALGRVQRAASKLGKMARAVNDNPNLTGEQKRKQLDDIQRQKNALYHQAYVTFNLGEW